MATESVAITPGAGANIAVDIVPGGIAVPVTKLGVGEDGVDPVLVSETNPIPVRGDVLDLIAMLLQTLVRSDGTPDASGRKRVNVETGSVAISSGTVTTVTTVTTCASVTALVDQTSIGGAPAREQIPALMRFGADAILSRITVTP